MKHPAILESGEGWIRFKQLSPDTLDELVDSTFLIDRLVCRIFKGED